MKKLDSMPPLGFATEICLFFGEWLSSKTFFRRWVDLFWTLAKKLQQIVKIVFLSVQRNIFRRKIFLRKNKKFHKSSDIERSFFVKKIGEKNYFLEENYQHSCQNWTLRFQRDVLGENMFPKRKPIRKNFCTLKRVFFSVIEFIWHVYQKRVPVYNWRFWEKSFFRTKNFPRNFIRTYAENCRTLAMNLLSIAKSAFH